MANYSSASCGMLLLSLGNLLLTAVIVISKVLGDLEWPYFRMLAIVNATGSCVAVCMIVCTRAQVSESGVCKWIVLRGGFGGMAFTSILLAVRLGAPPGDASALMSVNIVVAALVSFMFLKEPLHKSHGVSVICALAGAALIAKPEFMFGLSSEGGSPMFGYIFAIVAGFFQAGMFICSRIAGGVSFWYHTLSASIFQSLLCAILPYTSLVDDHTMQPLMGSPVLALIVLCALFVVFFVALIMRTTAAQLCPTAISATLNTASLMTFSYLAQLAVFGEKPDALALVGAALMLLAVFMIAVIQVSRPIASNSSTKQATVQSPAELDFQEIVAHSDVNARNNPVSIGEDDNESIASFVASEFVCFGALDETESSSQMRHRANRAGAMSDDKRQDHLRVGSQIIADAQIVGSVGL